MVDWLSRWLSGSVGELARQPVPVLLHLYPYSLSYVMHVCCRYVNCIHVASGFLFTGSGDRSIRKYEMDLENPTSETNGVYIHVSAPYCRSPTKRTLWLVLLSFMLCFLLHVLVLNCCPSVPQTLVMSLKDSR